MDDSFFTIFLIALAASFLPLQFGAEISLLANEDGVKRASSLVGGITLFRILVGVVIALLFAGEIAVFPFVRSLCVHITDIGRPESPCHPYHDDHRPLEHGI
jgi:hypothetical protein